MFIKLGHFYWLPHSVLSRFRFWGLTTFLALNYLFWWPIIRLYYFFCCLDWNLFDLVWCARHESSWGFEEGIPLVESASPRSCCIFGRCKASDLFDIMLLKVFHSLLFHWFCFNSYWRLEWYSWRFNLWWRIPQMINFLLNFSFSLCFVFSLEYRVPLKTRISTNSVQSFVMTRPYMLSLPTIRSLWLRYVVVTNIIINNSHLSEVVWAQMFLLVSRIRIDSGAILILIRYIIDKALQTSLKQCFTGLKLSLLLNWFLYYCLSRTQSWLTLILLQMHIQDCWVNALLLLSRFLQIIMLGNLLIN